MDYRELKWGALKSYATKLNINTKGMTKSALLDCLDAMPEMIHIVEEQLEPFKGIKQNHPLFDEIEPYLPYLKAFKKLNAISPVNEVTTAIATLFMKYIETDKRAALNLSCGRCRARYYERMIYGYNKLAEEYGRKCI